MGAGDLRVSDHEFEKLGHGTAKSSCPAGTIGVRERIGLPPFDPAHHRRQQLQLLTQSLRDHTM